MPRGRLSDDPTHSVTLWRGRLVEELRAEAVRLGARLVTGERLTHAETARPGRVRTGFESGLTDEGDLLVGADGIWSTARGILDPSAEEPVYGGYYTASGVSSGVDAAPGTLEPGTFNMVFAHAGAFISLTAPDGTVWWSAQVTAPAPPEPGSVTPERLARLYRHEEHPSAVLRAVTETHRPTPHHLLKAVRVWRGDRIVLAGDAAHPVGAGQGASMAIEDAAVLARAAATAPAVDDGLAAYESDRRSRVAKLLRMAAANREAKTAGPVARRVQDVVMPPALRFLYERSTAWLYRHELQPLPRISGV